MIWIHFYLQLLVQDLFQKVLQGKDCSTWRLSAFVCVWPLLRRARQVCDWWSSSEETLLDPGRTGVEPACVHATPSGCQEGAGMPDLSHSPHCWTKWKESNISRIYKRKNGMQIFQPFQTENKLKKKLSRPAVLISVDRENNYIFSLLVLQLKCIRFQIILKHYFVHRKYIRWWTIWTCNLSWQFRSRNIEKEASKAWTER